MHYNQSIKQIREETCLNIVAWSANNRGNGDRNLHVAIINSDAERMPTFRQQNESGTVIRDGYTSHWRGHCSIARIRKLFNL
jgi:hypothetical protein